jgi:TonB-dependent starch-binding outer membrane protein SusC
MGKNSGYFSNNIVAVISVLVCFLINNASYAKFSETILNDSTIVLKRQTKFQPDSLNLWIHSETSASVVTRLAPEDFANTTQPGIQSALQGKATGVYIQGGSGKLGQVINVRIRGTSSIAGNNQPLYIIDGMPFDDLFTNYTRNEPISVLSFLNPDDIEKIEIIRDASSAAYFGSMASNGAIVITTKKGRPGKTHFSFNTQIGVSGPANKIGFLNRQQYIALVEEGWNNVIDRHGNDAYNWLSLNNSKLDTWQDALDIYFPYWRDTENPEDLTLGPDQNWEEQIFRKGFTQQYNLAARGGREKLMYYTSLSYYNQESFIIHHDFERITGRINFDFKPNQKLTVSLKLNPTFNASARIPPNNSIYSPMIATEISPLEPLYFPGTTDANYGRNGKNPIRLLKYYQGNYSYFNGLGNLKARYDLTRNFHLTTELNGNLTQMKDSYSNNSPYLNELIDDVVSVNSLHRSENFFLTFQQGVREKINFKLVSGIRMNTFKNDIKIESTNSGSGSTPERSNLSYYVISSLNYKEKLFFEAIGRVEHSSVFPEKNSQFFSPFASASWIVIDKQQANHIFLPDFLKINMSYGISGSDQPFIRMGSSIPNFNLDWQKISHINAGIDFGFFKNQLSGELNVYSRKTMNGFIETSLLPFTQGLNYMTQNGAEIINSGIESALHYTLSLGKFQWYSSFNISWNSNKVTGLDGRIIYNSNWRVMENEPIGIFWIPAYAGVDPNNGDALFYKDTDKVETTTMLNQAEPQKAGDPNPDFFGGFSNNFKYKNFDLGFTFQFVYGNEIFNMSNQWQANGLSWFENQTVEFYENYWKAPGDNATYPQPRFLEGNGSGVSSMQLFDGSYLRLKDATLGYTVNSKTLTNYGVNSLRVFVRGLNLLTFTKYPGWDPEASYFGIGTANTIQQGWDFYNAPQPRTITFGVNIGF